MSVEAVNLVRCAVDGKPCDCRGPGCPLAVARASQAQLRELFKPLTRLDRLKLAHQDALAQAVSVARAVARHRTMAELSLDPIERMTELAQAVLARTQLARASGRARLLRAYVQLNVRDRSSFEPCSGDGTDCVCHCGSYVRDHRAYGSCPGPVPMCCGGGS